MLFSQLLNLYIAHIVCLKVSLYCCTSSVSHGVVENYFPGLWGTGIFNAIFFHLQNKNIYTGGQYMYRLKVCTHQLLTGKANQLHYKPIRCDLKIETGDLGSNTFKSI